MLKKNEKPRVLTFLIFFLSFGRLAIADEATKISPGDRVRVEVLDLSEDSIVAPKQIGEVIRFDQEILLLELSQTGKKIEIPRQDISEIEIFVDGRTKGEGAMMGAMIGLGVACLTGFLPTDDVRSEMSLTPLGRIVLTSLILVPLGAVTGAGLAPGERWELVPDSEMQVGFGKTPTGDRAVIVRVGF